MQTDEQPSECGIIRLAGIVSESIVDGPGIRFSLFVQGCPHECPGCQNPSTHPFCGGYVEALSEIERMILQNTLLDGITLTGGEPFCQPEPCSAVARFAHDRGLNVWAYSGFTVEEILSDPSKKALLLLVDVLVDGRFIEAQKDASLVFRGSKNQRIINVPESLRTGETVLWEPEL